MRIFAVIISVMLVLIGNGAALAQGIELTAAQRKALGIETVSVSSALNRPGARTFAGNVIIPPGDSTPVTSPFNSVLVELLVVPGSTVTAGTPVARLYSPDYEASRADLQTRSLNATHLRELAERTETLGTLGLRSQQEIDEARHDAASAQLAYETLRRSLSIVQPASGSGEFILTALRDGDVVQLPVAPGQSVDRAEPVVIIRAGDSQWMMVAVPEDIAAGLATGVSVRLEATGETGEIVALDPQINPVTRSVDVYVILPQERNWRVGQLVDVAFSDGAPGKAAYRVPARAIVRFGAEAAVFVDRPGGVERILVEIVSQDRSVALVSGDLKAGDRVVVSGLAALKNILEAE
ncbi:efflux RND transporter periplasmic adaptor subunit [Hyphomonas sp. WL0036]|uniref:efflux RND transporter periplasmic adaptor subunit n=1 Tax=Hyphomonas sediminis TaxID=2866160 RepID=UPI001C7F8892|nr:efflux RND transporter periplasmic adaptor subunit [Hyphomonas sediminis]MBY9068210.1 efflux RND transporter periplasmic adaptor subunit [Hyphomonas sediminis]